MTTIPYTQQEQDKTHPCNCVGPQIGQPVCPCRMRAVTIENGRYVEKRDLGPALAGEGTIAYPQDAWWLLGMRSTPRKCSCKPGQACGNVACPHRLIATC